MSHWENLGKSNEWYTPEYIFDAMGALFDIDVASPGLVKTWWIPARGSIMTDSLSAPWSGFVWMNPPFGGRNAIDPWLAKFFKHRNGVALTPDRTSAPWFQKWAPHATSILFLPKVRFIRPDGTQGKSPSNGTALMAAGPKGHAALVNAQKLGFLCSRASENTPACMPSESAVQNRQVRP